MATPFPFALQTLPGIVLAVFAALAVGISSARAHEVSYVAVGATFDTEARTFQIELAMEVDPSDDAAVNAEITPEDAARSFATDILSLYFGDNELTVEPSIQVIEPTPEDVDPLNPERRKAVAILAGAVPEGADYFTLHLSEETQATVIMIKIVDGKEGRRAEVLYPGEFSTPVDLRPETPDAAPDSPPSTDAATPEVTAGEGPDATLAPSGAPEVTAASALGAGFGRVLPQGFPLLTALLALTFFSKRPRDGWAQLAIFVTALILASWTARWLSLPALHDGYLWLALLIVAGLALESLFHDKLRLWRIAAIAISGSLFGLWLTVDAVAWTGGGSPAIHAAFLAGIVAAACLAFAVLELAVGPFRSRQRYERSLAFPANLITLGLAVYQAILHMQF